MEHRSRALGSCGLLAQVLIRDKFQDIVGGVTTVERTRLDEGKDDFILSRLVPRPERGGWGVHLGGPREGQQGHALAHPRFGRLKGLAWEGKGEMVEDLGRGFLKAQ